MPSSRDPALLLAAARLYYQDGRSQAEVAHALGTSRSNVSRMLAEAVRQSIVEIRINDPEGRVHELEEELCSRFGLTGARVAHAPRIPGLRMEDTVGAQAARLLLDEVRDGMTVALSWGHALQAMVYATTAEQELQQVSLVQLVGGLSSVSNEISGQELVRELAVRLGANYQFLHAPAILESVTSRDALLAEPSIGTVLRSARRADIALVGIGTPTHGSSAAILESLNLGHDELAGFWADGPVGDIAARYFTVQGVPVRGVVDDRVLGISLDELVRIPNVVGVVSGRAKTDGVLGALRGRIIDSLVCDEALARSVLSAAGRTASEESR